MRSGKHYGRPEELLRFVDFQLIDRSQKVAIPPFLERLFISEKNSCV